MNRLAYQPNEIQESEPSINVLIYHHDYFFGDPIMDRLASWEWTKSVASCSNQSQMELYVRANAPDVVLIFGSKPWVLLGEEINRFKLRHIDTSLMYFDSQTRLEQDQYFEKLKEYIVKEYYIANNV